MSKHPWMPFYVTDYILDTMDLSTEQHGVYFKLICFAWRRNGPLPNDNKWLRSLFPDLHGHSFNRLVPTILERFFTLDDDGNWRQKRIEKELEKADKTSAKAQQSANKRWENRDKDIAAVNENNDLVDASAMHHARVLQSQSQSQSPKKEILAKHVWPRDFQDQFWNVYPKKVAKLAAQKALDKVKRSDTIEFNDLLAAISRIDTKDPQFIPHPATWLNRGSYLDAPQTNGHVTEIDNTPEWLKQKNAEIRAERAARHAKANGTGTHASRTDGPNYQQDLLSESGTFPREDLGH